MQQMQMQRPFSSSLLERSGFSAMDFTDLIRTLSLVISFILLVVFDRKIWLNADLYATLGFGLAFAIFPRSMLVFQMQGELDSMHDQLTSLFGLSIASCALFVFFTKDTRDGTVPITVMLSRLFGCSVLLMCQVFTHWGATQGKKNNDWDEQHISFGMVGSILWMLGHVIHLVKSTDFSTYPQHNVNINRHLHIDALLIFLTSVGILAFPDFCIHYLFEVAKKDAIHTHMMRCIAVSGIGSSLISLQAPGFLHEHDKRYQFLSRIITVLGLLAAMLGLHFYLGQIVLKKIRNVALVSLPILINAVAGYFAGGTAFYRPKTKTS